MKKGAVVLFYLFIMITVFPFSAVSDPIVHDVQKVSGTQTLPVNPDAVDGLVNDAENSYAWCEIEYSGDIYVGTVRNYMAEMSMGIPGGAGITLPPGMFPPMSDDRGKIYKRSKTDLTGPWEMVYESPIVKNLASEDVTLEKGYRAMEVYRDSLYVVSYPFFTGPYSRILRFNGCSSDPEEVFRVQNTSGSGLRGMTIHDGKLYVGADSAQIIGENNGIPYGKTLVEIYCTSACPCLPPSALDPVSPDLSNMNDQGDWTLVGDSTDFEGIGYFPGWSGVWDMISFNGYLYVFIADPINGFHVFKGENPGDPGWHPVVSGLAGAMYPPGLGNDQNAAASPIVFGGAMYVGTFSNWRDLLMMMVQGFMGGGIEELLGGLVTVLQNWTPPQIYRSNGHDSWEMVIGDPGRSSPHEDFSYRIGNWRAGWYEAPSLPCQEIMNIFHSVFGHEAPTSMMDENFPNFSFQRYMWRWCVHDDRLYVSTVDPRSMFEMIPSMMGAGNEPLMDAIIMFFKLVNQNRSGFDLYYTETGSNWIPITQDGGFGEKFGYFDEVNDIIGDHYNGGRTMISTSEGIFLGTANAFKGCQIWLLKPTCETEPIPDPTPDPWPIPGPCPIPTPCPCPTPQETVLEGTYPDCDGIPFRIGVTPCSASDNDLVYVEVIEPSESDIAPTLKKGANWQDNSIFFSFIPDQAEKICYITINALLNQSEHPWLTEKRPDLWWNNNGNWTKIPLTWTKGTDENWTCYTQVPKEAWGSLMASTLDPEIFNTETSEETDPQPVDETPPVTDTTDNTEGTTSNPTSSSGGGGGCNTAGTGFILCLALIPMLLVMGRKY